MSTMNNLEKLIQIATIEQMYLMLEKLKANTNTNDILLSSTNIHIDFSEQIKKLENEMYNLNNTLKTSNNTICKLSMKISELEEELTSIKNDIHNTNENPTNFLKYQIKGQQKLDSYLGFVNQSPKEEKTQLYNEVVIKEEIQEIVLNKEDDVEYLGNNNKEPILIVIDEEVVKEVIIESLSENNVTVEQDVKEVVEELVKEVEEVVEELEEVVEEVVVEVVVEEVVVEVVVEEEEEEEEEEVHTEDELDSLSENNVTIEIKEIVKEEEQEQEQEQEEEEEEVFEIEIDDITYFATDEENGILYEMTKDGDIGKKVGIIKDGEPIFN